MALSYDGSKLVTASFPMAVIESSSLESYTELPYPIDVPVSVQFGTTSDVVYAFFANPSLVSVIDGSSGKQVGQIAVGNTAGWVTTNSRQNLVFRQHRAGDRRNGFGNLADIYVATAGDQIYSIGDQVPLTYNLKTETMASLEEPRALTGGDIILYSGLTVSPNNRDLYASFYVGFGTGGITMPDAAGQTSGLAIYDTATNSLVAQVNVPDVGSTVFSPDSSTAYVAGEVSTEAAIYLVDSSTKQVKTTWVFPQDQYFYALCISPDGSTIYALDGSYVYTIDSSTGEQLQSYAVPEGKSAYTMAISPDGTTLFLSDTFGGNDYPANAAFVMNPTTGSVATVEYSNGTYGVASAK
jgi:WD40 repeat protein